MRVTTAASDRGRYANHLEPAFGAVPLRDISPLRVRSFVAELATRRSPATVRHVHALLSTMLSDAVEEGLLLHNPCRRTNLPRTSPPPQTFLSPEQIAGVAAAIDPHYRQLVITAAGTGLRWGELTGLSPAAVDLLHGRLYVDRTLVDVNGELSFDEPKTRGSRRVISLSRMLVDGLTEQLTRATCGLVSPARPASRCAAATSTTGPGALPSAPPSLSRHLASTTCGTATSPCSSPPACR